MSDLKLGFWQRNIKAFKERGVSFSLCFVSVTNDAQPVKQRSTEKQLALRLLLMENAWFTFP